MPRIGCMYAGASGASHNVNKNSPGNGNGKWQGLPGLTNVRSALVYPIRTRANGDGLEKVFCINQLSGVGRISTMFASTADGVKEPCHGSWTGKSGGVFVLPGVAPLYAYTWAGLANPVFNNTPQQFRDYMFYSSPYLVPNTVKNVTFTSAGPGVPITKYNSLSGSLYPAGPGNTIVFKADNPPTSLPNWVATKPVYMALVLGPDAKGPGGPPYDFKVIQNTSNQYYNVGVPYK